MLLDVLYLERSARQGFPSAAATLAQKLIQEVYNLVHEKVEITYTIPRPSSTRQSASADGAG
jgi:hypothetical protein